MQPSKYLQMQFDRDRDLALAAQHGFTGVFNSAKSIVSDVYSGIERATWYSSCLSPSYQDICRNLGHEDLRTLRSLYSLFTKRDALGHVFHLYFEYVYGNIQYGNPHVNTRKNPYETAQNLVSRLLYQRPFLLQGFWKVLLRSGPWVSLPSQ